jgi:hypothetical protein
LCQVLLARASRSCFSLPWFNSFLCLRAPTPLLGSQILIRFLLGCRYSCSQILVFSAVCSTRAPGPGFGAALPLLKNLLLFINLLWFEYELLQGEVGIIFELSDKKLEFF